ncbi:SRPBCC family protein [Actinomadura graeca]|uniref:SRPBCC family protein n=1 Tax=Actinomadura graeca TaxID=2750812 RepID=UPI001E36F874|nr:SRPBCC domain-containing protein [Actinomadura graeca]
MELDHDFTVPVPVDQGWNVLLDVERVAACMPGATLDSIDGEEYKGRLKVKVGAMTITYRGTARIVSADESSRTVTLEAGGKEARGSGTASATVQARLHEQEDGTTRVTVRTKLNVTGRPAQFGRNILSEVGSKIIDRFAKALAEELESPSAETPEKAPSAGDTKPATKPDTTPKAKPEATTKPEKAPEAESAADPKKTTKPEKPTEREKAAEATKAAKPKQTKEPEKGAESEKTPEPKKTPERGKATEPEKAPAPKEPEPKRTAEPKKAAESKKAPEAEPATSSSSAAEAEHAAEADSAAEAEDAAEVDSAAVPEPEAAEADRAETASPDREQPASRPAEKRAQSDDAIDLLEFAGPSLAKRAVPAVGGLVALAVAVRYLTRHRKRR